MSKEIVMTGHEQSIEINGSVLEIKPLGAGREVGRSCFVLKYMGHNIMLDCGVHPAKKHGEDALPLFEYGDVDSIELLCVTHFHVDHCAALPYLVLERNYKGKILMTPPTKEIFGELFKEFHQMSSTIQPPKPVSPKEVLERIDTIKFHEMQEFNGMKIWCFNAGHILGAAMFCLEINGVKILYTGDFSGESDRHMHSAEVPPFEIDVMICESTYGIMDQEPRVDRENRFVKQIVEILKRGGKCLIPVFSLGRAQEFELILEEYWQSHKELWAYSIFFFSSIAKKCMTYFEKYTSFMNQELRKRKRQAFNFKFIRDGSSSVDDSTIDNHPCVVLASPGMLQDGFSRTLFERWCTDKNNGVIIPGYCVEGTLAKQIINDSSKPFTSTTGEVITPKCSVVEISFCAHSDHVHTTNFIGAVKPKHLVLIHGERKSMEQLYNSLKKTYPDLNIYMPEVSQAIQIPLQVKHEVQLLGEIAEKVIKMEEEKKQEELKAEETKQDENEPNKTETNEEKDEKKSTESTIVSKKMEVEPIINGVYLQNTKDVTTVIVQPKDIERFSTFHSNQITQNLYFPCLVPYNEALDALKGFYPELLYDETLKLANIKNVKIMLMDGELCITWDKDIITDLFVDHIVLLLIEMGISEKKEHIRKIPDIQAVSFEAVMNIVQNKFENVFLLKGKDEIKKIKDEIKHKNGQPVSNKEIPEQREEKVVEQKEKTEDAPKEEKIENQPVAEENDGFEDDTTQSYIVVKEKDSSLILKYPSCHVFGYDEDLLKRMKILAPRLKMLAQSTF
ncbi:Cleavage and polyadenylation specificity factor subunit, putative [Entamoeba invadens IP1]|uniref:Cleavage and polyadenylation specificity factor subunit, putative n=1 Tax=Entamoeba invadens IP1 TaxID=370355 RepID=A0A0A1U7Y2_ENTIV|nr:Cleavage and polyadenylation specificity factor subunit, putative [Entamoeba invadens IP1]ELP91039.1 Cleavage and polyadenylation specificity factor subunit, putative [Entamoeba invadens IP1]|eukprot:XP_004257810.1 Cleavage and polyadenylation specificity factor subunit, putative [Entamoeba invadens IP1]